MQNTLWLHTREENFEEKTLSHFKLEIIFYKKICRSCPLEQMYRKISGFHLENILK